MSTRTTFLEEQIKTLNTRLATVQKSNSELRDSVVELKSNYNALVTDLNERLKVIHDQFQK